MFKMKALFCLSILTAQAPAQPSGSVSIERTFFNPEHPELIDSLYQNLAYHVSVDFTARNPEPYTYTTVFWAISSTGPDPIYPTFQTWHLTVDSSHFEQYSGYFHTWGGQDHIMIFAVDGVFVFRFGLVYNLPWEFTPEELWENMDAVGIYEQDTLNFSWDVPDAEIHICQACPRNWLPVIDGYIDSSGYPNHDDFKVTLKAFFTSQNSPQSNKLRWVLKNISWYTGACMNYYGRLPNGDSLASDLERGGVSPVDPPAWYLSDLMILNQYNPNLACWYDTTQHAFYGQTPGTINTGDTISVVVSCYDFGAHGDIFLEARADSVSPFMNLTKHLEADSQYVNFTTIPRDEDNTYKDYLADYWEGLRLLDPHCPDTIRSILQIVPTQEMDDYIHPVLPTELGDYLNAFEEYRGFYCRGVHTRTSPWKKDFFIFSDLGRRSLNTGIGYAELIGPGLGHWIDATEMMRYAEPDTTAVLPILDRSVNWFADRIEAPDTCASTILLNKDWWDSASAVSAPLGATYHYNRPYVIPRTVAVSYLFSRRLRYHTPPNYDTTYVDMPNDSLCQQQIAGHEMGHVVNFRHNFTPDSVNSIMYQYIRSYTNPQNQYQQADFDSFLVKPTQ